MELVALMCMVSSLSMILVLIKFFVLHRPTRTTLISDILLCDEVRCTSTCCLDVHGLVLVHDLEVVLVLGHALCTSQTTLDNSY